MSLLKWLVYNLAMMHLGVPGSGGSGSNYYPSQLQKQSAGEQQNLTNTTQGTLNQFEGPVQQSPFYKALYDTGVSSTSGAYQNAQQGLRQRAQAAGLDNQQPVLQGEEAQLGSQEASAEAQVPNTALEEAVQPEIAAAGITAGEGNAYGNQAVQYGGQANQGLLQNKAQQAQLWGALANVGTDALEDAPWFP